MQMAANLSHSPMNGYPQPEFDDTQHTIIWTVIVYSYRI